MTFWLHSYPICSMTPFLLHPIVYSQSEQHSPAAFSPTFAKRPEKYLRKLGGRCSVSFSNAWKQSNSDEKTVGVISAVLIPWWRFQQWTKAPKNQTSNCLASLLIWSWCLHFGSQGANSFAGLDGAKLNDTSLEGTIYDPQQFGSLCLSPCWARCQQNNFLFLRINYSNLYNWIRPHEYRMSPKKEQTQRNTKGRVFFSHTNRPCKNSVPALGNGYMVADNMLLMQMTYRISDPYVDPPSAWSISRCAALLYLRFVAGLPLHVLNLSMELVGGCNPYWY